MTDTSGQTPRRWTWKRKVALAFLVLLVVIVTPLLVLNRAGAIRRQSEIDKIRAAGEPTTFAELDRLREPIPDEENSALLLEKQFDRLEQLKRLSVDMPVYRTGWAGRGERLSPEMMKLLCEYLDANKDLLLALHEAIKHPRGAYRVAWATDGISTSFSHVSPAREASRLLAEEAAYWANLSRVGPAMDSALGVWRVGESIGDEPSVISQLVRMANHALAVDSLENVMALGEPDLDALDRFAAELRRIETEPSVYRQAMLGERVMAMSQFAEMRGQASANTAMPIANSGHVFARLIPGYIDLNEGKYLQYMRRYIEKTSLPLKDGWRQIKELYEEAEIASGSKLYIIAGMLMPLWQRPMMLYVRTRTVIRAALAAIDAEKYQRQHHRWPKSLEELYAADPEKIPLDPFNDDKPLRYRLTDDGCVIYSIGEDGEDDNGRLDRGTSKTYDFGFQLISPDRRGARTTTQPIDEKWRKNYEKVIQTLAQPSSSTMPAERP